MKTDNLTDAYHFGEAPDETIASSSTDCIYRADAEIAIAGVISLGGTEAEILTEIHFLPTADVVEVVRCADCRSFQCNIRQDETGNLVVPVGVPKFECRWWCAAVSPKDYCSYAKRKKEADNG